MKRPNLGINRKKKGSNASDVLHFRRSELACIRILQTLPAREEAFDNRRMARMAGFSLHAGVAAMAHERDKRERLCRYITRPAVSEQRLSLTRNGWGAPSSPTKS